jgi:AraC-like DNA-binding protein
MRGNFIGTAIIWNNSDTVGQFLDLDQSPASGVQPAKGGLAPWQIKRVEAYIQSNFSRAIQVKELAAVANLSPSYFSRACAKSLGAPPHYLLNRYRVLKAANLIAQSTNTIADVAQECGLCDQAHLTRLFRRFLGTSPAVWRRRFQEGRRVDLSGDWPDRRANGNSGIYTSSADLIRSTRAAHHPI